MYRTFNNNYFKYRKLNCKNRIEQFKQDRQLIIEVLSKKKENICDVGCGTGEFLRYIKIPNVKLYGMEINNYAKKIASDIISFKKNIFTEKNFFDLVIFRGTIQHVINPFEMIKYTHRSLRKGGHILFLMTPNADSLLYRIKKNLPLLDWPRNYLIPGEKELLNALKNLNFVIRKVEFPYLNTPYESFFKDHCKFILNIFSKKFYPHAFWGSAMNIVAKKKN